MSLTCEAMVEDHLDAAHAYALSKLRQEDLTREIVQCTFLKAFENRGQLRDALAARGGLLSILRNEIANDAEHGHSYARWENGSRHAQDHE